MRRALFALPFLFLITGLGCAPPSRQVEQVLDRQAAAWNRGDLRGFMDGYWQSDELTFVVCPPATRDEPRPATRIVKGWQATFDRYRERYSDPKQMGRLVFSELLVTFDKPDEAHVTGRYELTRADQATSRGRFILDMHRIDKKWVIVQDRTIAE